MASDVKHAIKRYLMAQFDEKETWDELPACGALVRRDQMHGDEKPSIR